MAQPASRGEWLPGFDDSTKPPCGHETIMVVDDEPLVLRVSVHELKRLGYHVVPARSGEEALELLKTHAVDLLIIDLMMPGLSGLESFRRIRSIQPHLKTLVYTGYAPAAAIEEIEALGAHPFLIKPAPLGELARAVRSRLDETEPTPPDPGSRPT
jgi:CheY-like chemotaxis protein